MVNQLNPTLQKVDKFFKVTDGLFQEYKLWKLETDLFSITVGGIDMKIEQVNYIDWLKWRMEQDIIENKATEEVQAFTEFELVEE